MATAPSTGTATATTRPTPRAPQSPTPIPIDSIARVVTNDLRVRSAPEVSEASTLLKPLLQKGQAVFVVAGPVKASGYEWYEVKPVNVAAPRADLPFGWVASAGRDGQTWLAAQPPKCPALPTDYAAFRALAPLVGLACFGDGELKFAARIGQPEATCGVDPGWDIEPGWLASTCPHPTLYLADTTSNDFDLIQDAIIDPGFDSSGLKPGVVAAEWLAVEVTGRRDNDAAKTCRGVTTGDVEVEMAPDEIVLTCRAQFVITKLQAAKAN